MIVGQFGEAFPPINDGVAQVVKNYAYWLNKKYGKSYVSTCNVPNVVDDYPYEVLRFRSHRLIFKHDYRIGIPRLDRAFYKNIINIKFDIVHAHSPFAAGKLALDIAKRQNIPSVMTFHTKLKQDFKAIVKSSFIADRMIDIVMKQYSNAEDVWTVSESAVETMREYGYKGPVYVVENACDFAPEKRSKEALDMINHLYHIPEDAVVFAFVGQMIYQKNIRLIAKALKIVQCKGCDFRMLFVGVGDKKNEMERLIKSYNLDDKVIFTGNIHNRVVLKNIYLRSQAIIFPSLYDVSSLVIKEAASAKCPMILVENSTTAQGVVDMENGFLVQNDENSLAVKIEMILNNEDIAKKAGEGAFKTLYISWEQSVDKAYERYQYLIDRKKSRNYAKS
ncbi:MAG: glycosyltransferase [Clostridiales bacterium]|nr:glycosyltransferase [Clostridiales bacterium]